MPTEVANSEGNTRKGWSVLLSQALSHGLSHNEWVGAGLNDKFPPNIAANKGEKFWSLGKMLEIKQKCYLILLQKYHLFGPGSVHIGLSATSKRRKNREGKGAKQGHLKGLRGRGGNKCIRVWGAGKMKTSRWAARVRSVRLGSGGRYTPIPRIWKLPPSKPKRGKIKHWTWRTTSKSEFIKFTTVGRCWKRHRIS